MEFREPRTSEVYVTPAHACHFFPNAAELSTGEIICSLSSVGDNTLCQDR